MRLQTSLTTSGWTSALNWKSTIWVIDMSEESSAEPAAWKITGRATRNNVQSRIDAIEALEVYLLEGVGSLRKPRILHKSYITPGDYYQTAGLCDKFTTQYACI